MALTIIKALSDPSLFGPWFRAHAEDGDGADTWAAWRAFLKAVYALKMDGSELELYRKFTGRQEPPTKPFREAFAVCGRRGGKSMMASLVAVFQSCFADNGKSLYPGERPLVMVLAGDRRQAEIVLAYIKGFFEEIPLLRAMVQSQKAGTLRLSNGVRLEVHTSSFKRTRGYTLCCVIADEIAFWQDADSRNPAGEVLNAVRPGLLTIKNSLLLCISSPYSRRGVLYESWKKHWGQDGARVLYWRASTQEMNPSADAEEIAEAYAEDPARARAEYGGEFRADLESLFTVELVESLIERGAYERRYIPPTGDTHRARYVGFVDPSGGRSDSFGLGIAHAEGGKVVLDVLREIVPPFSPAEATAEFCEVLKRYGLREVTGDSYAAQYSAELFEKNGIKYIPCDRTRSELYLEMVPMMMSARVTLLDHRKMVNQFCALERRTGRNADVVDHGPGGHDDVSNAAAGCLVLAMPRESARVRLTLLEQTGQLSWVPGNPIAQVEAEPVNLAGQDCVVRECANCGSSLWVLRGPLRHCNHCGNDVFIRPPNGIPVIGGRVG